jgi:hypothetical protein
VQRSKETARATVAEVAGVMGNFVERVTLVNL